MLPAAWPVEMIVRLDVVDSTSNELARRLACGAPVGTAVVAKEQTGGRGQLGRTWFSPPGSLYASVSLRHHDPTALPFAAGLGVLWTLFRACGFRVGGAHVRWPNDIIVRGRKIAGVLVEAATEQGVWIIGCGINVNVSSFPPELSASATSVLLEQGWETEMDGLLGVEDLFFLSMGVWLSVCEDRVSTLRAWRVFDCTPGSLIRVREGDGDRIVEAVGVDDEGRLMTNDGGKPGAVIGASVIDWLRSGPPKHAEE